MKKSLFILPLLTIFTLYNASAQAQDVRFGLKGGATLYNSTISFSSFGFSIDETSDRKLGFAAGIFVEKPFTDLVSLQFEGLYVQKGGSDEDSEFGEGDLTLSYIDVPILLLINLPLGESAKPYVYGGGYLGYLLDAKADTDEESVDDFEIKDFLKDFNYGLAFGAGVTFGAISVDLRYDLGLANIFDPDSDLFGELDDFDEFGDFSDLLGGIKVSTSGLMFTVGVSF